MKKFSLYLLVLLIVNSVVLSQSGWNLLTTQEDATIVDAISFTAIEFIDIEIGWACGSKGMANGAIFKTEDGGSTWNDVLLTGMFDQFQDICFCDNNVIWAGGYKNMSKACLLYKSDDGGITWNTIELPENLGVRAMHFSDVNNGWVILRESGSSRIYNTTDGGESWNLQMNGTTSDGWTIRELYCWYFFDAENAIAAGNYGHIIFTNDGGDSWNYRDAPISVQLSGIHFIDNNTGWIVGGAGYILKTTDGGLTWQSTHLDIQQSLTDVYFKDEQNGWITGGLVDQGILYSTNDGGETWNQVTLASNRDLNSIFFLNESAGWIAGSYGTVYKYGSTTDAEKIYNQPVKFSLKQNYPNPFNPATTIEYAIPASNSPLSVGIGGGLQAVKLVVYDVLGREVATLVNKQQKPGNYRVSFDGKNLATGIYFYRLDAGDFRDIRKILLIK